MRTLVFVVLVWGLGLGMPASAQNTTSSAATPAPACARPEQAASRPRLPVERSTGSRSPDINITVACSAEPGGQGKLQENLKTTSAPATTAAPPSSSENNRSDSIKNADNAGAASAPGMGKAPPEAKISQNFKQKAAEVAEISLFAVAVIFFLISIGLVSISMLGRFSGGFYFRRHWGGFGGSSTGWFVSKPLAQAMTGVILAVLSCTILINLAMRDMTRPSGDQNKKSDTPQSAPAQSSGTKSQ